MGPNFTPRIIMACAPKLKIIIDVIKCHKIAAALIMLEGRSKIPEKIKTGYSSAVPTLPGGEGTKNRTLKRHADIIASKKVIDRPNADTSR